MAPLSVHNRGRGWFAARHARGRAPLVGQLAKPRVRRHPTGDQQRGDPEFGGCADRLHREHIGDGFLEPPAMSACGASG